MHIIILEKENEFSPHPRAYNVNFNSNARPPVWTEAHMAPARYRIEEKSACAPDARLWGIIPARLCQKSEKKNPDGFLSNLR
jgi:hypothetical protein